MRRAALLAVVAALTACGGTHHPTTRDGVIAYVGRVNVVESQMQKPLLQVQRAVQSFVKHRNGTAAAAALGNADVTLARLRKRLAAANPPPAARRLHRLLLELVDRERTLADELRRLDTFDPAFAAALRPLTEANATAQAQLHGSHRASEVSRAVRVYRAAVKRSLEASRALDPPSVERPLYDAQVARLATLDQALGDLLAAVAKRNGKQIAAAEHAISVASVSPDSTANQQAQRDAVKEFNGSVREITSLVRRIARERDRLQTNLK